MEAEKAKWKQEQEEFLIAEYDEERARLQANYDKEVAEVKKIKSEWASRVNTQAFNKCPPVTVFDFTDGIPTHVFHVLIFDLLWQWTLEVVAAEEEKKNTR